MPLLIEPLPGAIFRRKTHEPSHRPFPRRIADSATALEAGAPALLCGCRPVSLFPMNSGNPEATKAPLHFNFATDVIDRWAEQRPEAPALWCVNAATGAGQKFSFRELAALSCQAAEVLRSSGVRRGDRVLVMLPRVPQWWIAMLGLIVSSFIPFLAAF